LNGDSSSNKPCEWGDLSLNPKREVFACEIPKVKASNPRD
jgi:hypothetical protein